MNLKSADIQLFEQRLCARREALRQILHAELIASCHPEYIDLAGQVNDVGDRSVAELLIGIELSGRERELAEMRHVEAALRRIAEGRFGICIDCGKSIERGRLDAYPTAERCVACQRRYEQSRQGAKDLTPSL